MEPACMSSRECYDDGPRDWDKDDKKDMDHDGKMDRMLMDHDDRKDHDGKMDMDKMSKEDKMRMDRKKKGGKGGKMGDRMCCARAQLHDKKMEGGMPHDIYRCMDKRVVHENNMMEMEDMMIEMNCVDGGWNAATGLMATASTIGLIAMTLF